jgi:hypothetical protein
MKGKKQTSTDSNTTLKDHLHTDMLQKLKEAKKELEKTEQQQKVEEERRKREERIQREKNKTFEELLNESNLNWKDFK